MKQLTHDELRSSIESGEEFVSMSQASFYISNSLRQHFVNYESVEIYIDEENGVTKFYIKPAGPDNDDAIGINGTEQGSSRNPMFSSTNMVRMVREIIDEDLEEGCTYRFDAEWDEDEKAVVFEVHDPINSSHKR